MSVQKVMNKENTSKKSAFLAAFETRSYAERVFTKFTSEEVNEFVSATVVAGRNDSKLVKLVSKGGQASKFLLDYDCPAVIGDRLRLKTLEYSNYEDTFIIKGDVI